ncbi:MAG: hypothetical protein K8R28_04160 [Desulfobacterales bacterium]|nr:hypothetical protein [Desulfobacterales bacterium]
MFTGPDLTRHDKEYRNGHALVNPLQFRESLNHLKDILFEELREHPASREHYAAARELFQIVNFFNESCVF